MGDANNTMIGQGLNLSVHAYMESPAVTIQLDTTFSEGLRLMEEGRHRRFVVVDDKRRLKGMVTELDLKQALPSPVNSLNKWELKYLLSDISVKDIMTERVITTTPDATLKSAASLMIDHKISGLPVVDDGDRVLGIITMTTIVQILFGQLTSCDCFKSNSLFQ
jgi:acetoin utilization protein AcuB